MSAPVPAVCQNGACRAVFFSYAYGGYAKIIDCTVGPCPRCGGIGLIPNGTYDMRGARTLFVPHSDADREFLERALGIVRDAVDGKISAEEFQEKAKRAVPELSALWKLAPETKDQAYHFWMMVIAVLTLCLMAYQTFKPEVPSNIHLPKDVADAIESARRENRVDSRKEQRKARDKEMRRRKR